MKMCCKWLENLVGTMNTNGISFVPRARFGDRYFAVRFRWVNPQLWQSLSQQLPQMTPFATAGECLVNHCPGCGTKLDDWIAAHPTEFDTLLSQVID